MTEEESRLFEKSSTQVVEVWLELKAMLGTLGRVGYEFKKTSIHCMKTAAFLGVHPKKNWLDLNIVLDRTLYGIVECKVEQVSKKRFHNEIRLKMKEEIQGIAEFIKESFLKGK